MTSLNVNAEATYLEESATSRWFAFFATAVLAFLLTAPRLPAQSAGEKTFASPGDAALALYTAAKAQDNQTLDAIFGSHADEILHTGDPVADKKMVSDFIRRYEEMRRVVIEPDHTVDLYIGADNWQRDRPCAK